MAFRFIFYDLGRKNKIVPNFRISEMTFLLKLRIGNVNEVYFMFAKDVPCTVEAIKNIFG
jgi:hypothetical protein